MVIIQIWFSDPKSRRVNFFFQRPDCRLLPKPGCKGIGFRQISLNIYIFKINLYLFFSPRMIYTHCKIINWDGCSQHHDDMIEWRPVPSYQFQVQSAWSVQELPLKRVRNSPRKLHLKRCRNATSAKNDMLRTPQIASCNSSGKHCKCKPSHQVIGRRLNIYILYMNKLGSKELRI